MENFKEKVLAVVRKIPRGGTLSYRQVAEKAGNPKAARAVGAVLNKNCDSSVPCHRVIMSNGRLGGYNRGVRRKKQLLLKEKTGT